MPVEQEWYDKTPSTTEFSQGDILRNVPFPTWPTFIAASQQVKLGVLRPLRSGKLRLTEQANSLPAQYEARARRDVPDAFSTLDAEELVVARCRLRSVILLTRSCSLDNPKRKHVLVAPVTAIQTLPEEERRDDKLASLRSDEIPHLIHLPATNSMPEGLADLLKMTSIHRSFLSDDRVGEQLIARLSALGTMRLQQKLAHHFGTQFGYDHEDICPKDGVYSCSACFHSGREISRVKYASGTVFGKCKVCGELAAFVHVG